MLRFLTDENLPDAVVEQLRKHSIDIVRWIDVGAAGAPDDEILIFARTEERAVITKDDDFIILAKQWMIADKPHSGIFFCHIRDRPMIGAIVSVCRFWYEAVLAGAASIEEDVINQIHYIC